MWSCRAEKPECVLPHLPEIQPAASEIRTPPYSGHTYVVPMVSALERFHCRINLLLPFSEKCGILLLYLFNNYMCVIRHNVFLSQYCLLSLLQCTGKCILYIKQSLEVYSEGKNCSVGTCTYILLPGLVGSMARYCTSVYKYFP